MENPPPDPGRKPRSSESDPIREAHDAAEAQGRAGYLDPQTGLFVMTSGYLAERGYCCGNGCRHCPYPPDIQAAAGRPT